MAKFGFRMNPVSILALDPSFRNLGWAVLNVWPDGEEVIASAVITTKKANKKLKRFAADDNHQCAQHLADKLIEVIKDHHVKLICAESSWGFKGSKAAQLAGMTWGVLSAVSLVYRLPVLQATPTEIKEANVGTTSATKEEVREAVLERYPEAKEAVERVTKEKLQEHGYDAIAAAVACLRSTEIATLRTLAG